jgi:hypothetical protein
MGIRPHRRLRISALGVVLWVVWSLPTGCVEYSPRKPDAGGDGADSLSSHDASPEGSSDDALPDGAAGDADPCAWVPNPVPCGCSPEPLQTVDPSAPCTFAIPNVPPDPDNVAVYLNKQLVPRASTDGWQYGPTTATLVFTGSYCDLILASPSPPSVQLLCGCSSLPSPCIIP